MNRKTRVVFYLILSLSLLLDACGGGSSGSASGHYAEGGIGGTGISNGPISGFGSIFVNGVEYHTQSADVFVEGVNMGSGDVAVANNLAIGKVVTVQGSIPSGNQATATRVDFNDNVEGPVQSITQIDANTRQLIVLGQTVIVDANTRLVNTSLNALSTNNLVEISGVVTQTGAIQATYLEKKLDSFPFGGSVEVQGWISNFNGTAQTFTISSLQVAYAGADLTALTTPLGNGLAVEIKGSYSGGVFQASRIEPEPGLGTLGSTSWLSLDGYINSFVSATNFSLGGQSITTTAATRYENGSVAGLAAGVRIQVEGNLQAGVLTATEIKFQDAIELQAKVASVSPAGLTLVAMPGTLVTVDTLTEIDGTANSLLAINVGQFAKVRGKPGNQPNEILASKIEVENPSSIIEVRFTAVPTVLNNPFITIIGTTIDSSGVSYRAADDSSISAAQFFSQATTSAPLRVEGELVNATNAMTWTRVRLQGAP